MIFDICTKYQLEIKKVILVLIKTLNFFKFVIQAVNLPLPLKAIIGGKKQIDIIHFISLMTHSISNKHVSYVSLFILLVKYGSHGNIRDRINEKNHKIQGILLLGNKIKYFALKLIKHYIKTSSIHF